MKPRPSPIAVVRASPTAPIRQALKLWLLDGDDWSPRTLRAREDTIEKFAWWMEKEAERPPNLSEVNPLLVREFLAYVRKPAPGGRWGNERPQDKARPSTVDSYYRILRAFCNFCTEERLLSGEALANVKRPRVPKDEVEPFTREQFDLLLNGARASSDPARDEAVVKVLFDTGLRVAELCSLSFRDYEHAGGRLYVIGKGNKRRSVHLGIEARRAIWRYLEQRHRVMGGTAPDEAPLFAAGKGRYEGGRLTPNGVHNIIARAGKAGGVKGVRCSPHTLRHTFAVNFLKNGGNIRELQKLMGHEDISALMRYLTLAEVDVEQAHRRASPLDRLKRR